MSHKITVEYLTAALREIEKKNVGPQSGTLIAHHALNGEWDPVTEESHAVELERRDATRRCKGCGCEISLTASYCGECMCEEDGV